MRVITGIARGKKLKQPANDKIRPTTDMVKESIFNIIQYDIEGRDVLDLFGGTGQLALEAVSRGAKSAVIVDNSGEAGKIIRNNIAITGLKGIRYVCADALNYLERPEKYDLVFLDPPYYSTFLESSLQKIVEFDKMNVGGIIICESLTGEEPGELILPYQKLKTYRYGQVGITLFTRRDGRSTPSEADGRATCL